MGTEAQRASIRRKAPQRVSDPAAGCAPSSASTQCHGRPALTREMKGHCTSQLRCTRSHTCAHVHVHTHLVLHLLQSAHGVPSARAYLQRPRPHQAGLAHPSEGPAGSPRRLPALDLVPAADGAGDRNARTQLSSAPLSPDPIAMRGVKSLAPSSGRWAWGRPSVPTWGDSHTSP